MAARTLYLPSSGVPAHSISFDAGWFDTSSADQVAAVWDTPSASPFATLTVNAPALPAWQSSWNTGPRWRPYICVRQYETPPLIDTWASGTGFVAGQMVIDGSAHVQQVVTAGTSGGSTPSWNDTGGTTTDGTITWQDNGTIRADLMEALFALYPTARVDGSFSGGGISPYLGTSVSLIKLYDSSASFKGYVSNPFVANGGGPPSAGLGTEISGGTHHISGSLSSTSWFRSASGGTFPTIAAGDFLIIEIGYFPSYSGTGSTPSAVTVTAEFGDSAAGNLARFNDTSQLNSWASLNIPSTHTPGPPGPPGPPANPGSAWLIAVEPITTSPPAGGPTDRSTYLFTGNGTRHSFNLQVRQRGNATYQLRVMDGDPYQPTIRQLIYLYDQNIAGATLAFSGIVQDYTNRWVGISGFHYCDVTAVSLEALFDTVLVTTPMQFVNQTCGAIVTALFNAFEAGCAVTLGIIQAGATIPLFNANNGDKLSDLFSQLATTSAFTWNVNVQSQALFFGVPTTVAAPFTITSVESLWDQTTQRIDGADYRNRQLVKLTPDAFPHSDDYFIGAGQTSFTLRHPAAQVTNAWITTSTPNIATGIIAVIDPVPGDTFTIGPANGAWQQNHIYALNGVIVVKGFVQKVTTAGTSNNSGIPAFSMITGQTTVDGSVIWTCQGPLGLSTGQDVYTAVAVLDNTQFGQFLIGSTFTKTAQNLVDAINAKDSARGVTISLPTWECAQCNAGLSGSGGISTSALITLTAKTPGSGWVSAISTTMNTSFPEVTSGGTSPQTGVGPGEAATISIAVYANGTGIAAPCLVYTPGSASVNLATPLNNGTNLVVEYTRADAGVIQVERTDLVLALQALIGGTGKVQQSTDASNTGLIATSPAAGLLLAQQALAAFDVVPEEIDLQLFQPGLAPGQQVTIALDAPLGTALNGNFFIEEIRAQLIPTWPWIDGVSVPGGGHYKSSIHMIDLAQIGSYMDFWQSMSSGGGGGAIPLVATSGGIQPSGGSSTSPTPFSATFSSVTSYTATHNLNRTAVIVMVYDVSGNQVIPQNIAITDANTVTLTFGGAFIGSVVIM